MFVWGLSSHSRIFHSYGDVTITGEGLQILTYARHSWPFGIEQWGFFSVPHLLWHWASVYNGHLRGPVTLVPIAEHLEWSCHYLFLRLRSVAAGIWTTNLLLVGPMLIPTALSPRSCIIKYMYCLIHEHTSMCTCSYIVFYSLFL